MIKQRKDKYKQLVQSMKRKSMVAGALCIAAVCLGGCGNQIPDMTEEEQQAITDYAVELVLKYDVGHQSRLVALSADASAAVTEAPKAEVTPAPEVGEGVETEITETMAPTEVLPEEVLGGTTAEKMSIEEVLDWEGSLKLDYKECTVLTSYDAGALSVDAAEGNRLLVATFTLSNPSTQTQRLNMIAGEEKFYLAVGDGAFWKCQMTLLENDLSTFFGEIGAGESREVILIIEGKEELLQDVQALSLKVENGALSATRSL